MQRSLVVFSLMILSIQSHYAQNIQTAKGKDFVPVSPSAASLGTYGQIPVGYFTGVPEIGIDLYNVQYKELSVPIRLQYHAAGNKPDVIPGPVGLGMTLLAGGSVTRIINGYPDEGGYNTPDGSPLPVATPTTANDWSSDTKMNLYLSQNQATLNDSGDPDEYYFNVNGISGRFAIAGYVPGPLPGTTVPEYRITSTQGIKLKIKVEEVTSKTFTMPILEQQPTDLHVCTYANTFLKARMIYKIIITDNQGTEYTFGGEDNAIEFSRPGFSTLTPENERFIVPTTWYLTSVKSRFNYAIQFNYDRGMPIVTKTTYTDIPKFTWKTITANPDHWPVVKGEKSTLINPSKLREIVTPVHTITFSNSTADGQLWFPPDPHKGELFNLNENDFHSYQDVCEANTEVLYPYKIDAIAIKDKLNIVTVKNVNFNYTSDTFTRLKLLSVEISGSSTETQPQRYSFQYNATPLPGYMSYKTDMYGYYNGRNDFIISETPQNYYNIDQNAFYASKQPDEMFAKAEILERLYYPTSGLTRFEYELNSYGTEAKTWPFVTVANASSINTGGLRIKKISNYSAIDEIAFTKRYFYVKNYATGGTLSSGVLSYKPVFFDQYSGTLVPPANQAGAGGTYNGTVTYWRFNTDPIYPMTSTSKSHVTYSEVAEVNDDNSFTVYKFKNYDNGYHDETPLNKVSDNTGLKEFWKEDTGTSLELERGLPLSEEVYNASQGGLVKKTTYSYNDTPAERAYNAIRILSRSVNSLSIVDNIPSIRYTARLLYTYFPYVKQQTETIYNTDGSTLTTIKQSTYRQDDRLVTEQTTYGSGNEEIKITNKYPSDLVAEGVTDPYQDMVNKNILPIVEQDIQKNSNPALKTKTNFKKWSAYVYAPENEEVGIGNASLEERVVYKKYDALGNPLTLSNKNNIDQAFLWGYASSLPIAKIDNATSDEVFVDNFEEGTGWDGNLTAYDNTGSHTGRYSGKIVKTTSGEQYSHSSKWLDVSLPATTRFKYSGWIYSNGPSADIYLFMKTSTETNYYTYVDHVTTSTTNKWVYLEKEFDVPPNITRLNLRIDNNGGGTVWFDDLRLHPSDAEVTTYTYDPITGITSMVDSNNIAVRYEYDESGRLKYVKDDDLNIVKKYEYNYQVK